ncbi:hypothetical protein C8F04DRAFT_1102359 [Mycena alexandri]|uniref:Uncharacterized protein n=1 Tax=Mycena alexandri TaxID=1745969 RepID=A0AAD6X6N3_9AGAR|nr:hypothetical protein C8F04DRAFT_1102359 [Mycena alexandri]
MEKPIEQDRFPPTLVDDDLPTYDDLAAQEGPNSRFGRWRGWIEKRAAERYLTITPEERARRRERGWGNEEMDEFDPEPPTPTVARLSVQTQNLRLSTLSEPPSPPLPPTPRKRLLLLGTDEGLAVLDMYPQDWDDKGGIEMKGPEDAAVRAIWTGESVFQMSILELENASGVVLMLVGPEPESPLAESARTVRMYNLASLLSLAKWAVANKGAHPLNLGTFTAQQTTPKKHRPTSSIARGLKSLVPTQSSSSSSNSNPNLGAHEPSYPSLLSPQSSLAVGSIPVRTPPPPHRANSDESSWEVIDDLPLRWSRDFVPLAAAGSRLVNTSVLMFALWTREEGARTGSPGQFLAVGTKGMILLYETPVGERAFRFVKEFYTPLQPKRICFFQQSVQDVARSPTDVHSRHRRSGSHTTSGTVRAASFSSSSALLPNSNTNANYTNTTTNYGTQLSIFVVFEKKAGWIRLADSAVGEMELFEDTTTLAPHPHPHGSGYGQSHSRTPSASPGPGSLRRRHVSGPGDAHASNNGGGPHSRWLPPVRCELPASNTSPSRNVYVLTRGPATHVVPCPLPSTQVAPLAVFAWRVAPANVTPRVGNGVLQLTALGEGSVEVVEVPLAALGVGASSAGASSGKGKGKAHAEDGLPVRVEEDAGGETGFLCPGGHWDDPHQNGFANTPLLQRAVSDASGRSWDSTDTEEAVARLRREQGIYGWCRKGLTDWRVFWLGGSFEEEEEE